MHMHRYRNLHSIFLFFWPWKYLICIQIPNCYGDPSAFCFLFQKKNQHPVHNCFGQKAWKRVINKWGMWWKSSAVGILSLLSSVVSQKFLVHLNFFSCMQWISYFTVSDLMLSPGKLSYIWNWRVWFATHLQQLYTDNNAYMHFC